MFSIISGIELKVQVLESVLVCYIISIYNAPGFNLDHQFSHLEIRLSDASFLKKHATMLKKIFILNEAISTYCTDVF